MSTAVSLKMALTGARQAYDAYADYRDRKVSEAYDTLAAAAENYGPRADHAVESARELYDDSKARAGNVTKAARTRLEKALEAAEKQGTAAVKDVKKSGKKLNRKARRQAGKAERKLKGEQEGTRWLSRLAVATLVVSGIAAVYAVTVSRRKKEEPGTAPPRVEVQLKKAADLDQPGATPEQAGEDEPKLVYSTVTPDEAPDEVPAEVLDADAPLDPEAEEDIIEELTEGEAVQQDFDKKNAPRRADGKN